MNSILEAATTFLYRKMNITNKFESKFFIKLDKRYRLSGPKFVRRKCSLAQHVYSIVMLHLLAQLVCRLLACRRVAGPSWPATRRACVVQAAFRISQWRSLCCIRFLAVPNAAVLTNNTSQGTRRILGKSAQTRIEIRLFVDLEERTVSIGGHLI